MAAIATPAAAATAAISGATLALAGVLDFDSVIGVDIAGRQWLEGAAPAQCNLDLGAITYSSSAGVALLLGWLRVARQQHRELRIQRMPADMSALVRVGGLADFFIGV